MFWSTSFLLEVTPIVFPWILNFYPRSWRSMATAPTSWESEYDVPRQYLYVKRRVYYLGDFLHTVITKPFQCGDALWCQILTYKDGPRSERIKTFIMAVYVYTKVKADRGKAFEMIISNLTNPLVSMVCKGIVLGSWTNDCTKIV